MDQIDIRGNMRSVKDNVNFLVEMEYFYWRQYGPGTRAELPIKVEYKKRLGFKACRIYRQVRKKRAEFLSRQPPIDVEVDGESLSSSASEAGDFPDTLITDMDARHEYGIVSNTPRPKKPDFLHIEQAAEKQRPVTLPWRLQTPSRACIDLDPDD